MRFRREATRLKEDGAEDGAEADQAEREAEDGAAELAQKRNASLPSCMHRALGQ